MYTVTVLTPMGRRQQVKVTPNTTLLQVLEEVCSKHGFSAQDYDLRHHNKILDVSTMFRFTNLPNNAQLEMTEAVKQRQESPVTLGLQFETGDRLTGDFSPSECIWNVIISLKPDEVSDNLVVIYMRQEIYGLENLKKTTLRSLGLTGGRAMLRVFHKTPEELHNQANVSSILTPRVAATEKTEKDKGKGGKASSKSPEQTKKGVEKETPKTPPPESVSVKAPSPEAVRKEAKYKDTAKLRGNVFENLLKDERTKRALLENKNKTDSKRGSPSEAPPIDAVKKQPDSKPKIEVPAVSQKIATTDETPKEESKVILLGDRNAVAFNLNSVKPTPFEEEPEDFYDLTIYDAKILLKQAKQLCADLEDAPLMTSAQREFEKDKKVLSLLHQYKKTVLRVTFPDRTVLQGTFSSLETVAAVEKFVSQYLESPSLRFYLYTTPPKVILKSETRLIECGCVPSCILYFGLPPEVVPPSQYLKAEVLEKLSTPSAAALHAYQSRGMDRRTRMNESEDLSEPESDKRKWLKSANSSEAGPSGSKDWESSPKDHGNSPHFKIPKWFRTNK